LPTSASTFGGGRTGVEDSSSGSSSDDDEEEDSSASITNSNSTPAFHTVAPLTTLYTSSLHKLVPVLTCLFPTCNYLEFPGCGTCGCVLGEVYEGPETHSSSAPPPTPATPAVASPTTTTRRLPTLRSLDTSPTTSSSSSPLTYPTTNYNTLNREQQTIFMVELSSVLEIEGSAMSSIFNGPDGGFFLHGQEEAIRQIRNEGRFSLTASAPVVAPAAAVDVAVAVATPNMPPSTSAHNYARCPTCKNVSTMKTKPWAEGE